MKLKDNGIHSVEDWFRIAPPEDGIKQWKDGRSAKELARYLTSALPGLPKKMEAALLPFASKAAIFDWCAEYQTELPGKGHPRQHDAALWNRDLFVGIEAKADEPFGNSYVSESYLAKDCSKNKKMRINTLCSMLWGMGDDPSQRTDIRYQLLTASTACLWEASRRGLKRALLLILVFKHEGCYQQENIDRNNADLAAFLKSCHAVSEYQYHRLQTGFGEKHGIDLYVKKLELERNIRWTHEEKKTVVETFLENYLEGRQTNEKDPSFFRPLAEKLRDKLPRHSVEAIEKKLRKVPDLTLMEIAGEHYRRL